MPTKKSPLVSASDLGIYDGTQPLQVSDFIEGGGHMGAGFNAQYLDSATPLTFTPTVMTVLTTPRMYRNIPNFGRVLKTLIETHCKTVTGIDFGYEMQTEEGGMTHDGQAIQVPTQSQRTTVTPSFTLDELPGNLVWRLFYTWLRDMQDPDTNTSMQYKAREAADEETAQFTMTDYTMTLLAIQFDRIAKPDNIIEAALYTNMFPTDPGGPVGFERTIGTTKVVEREVTMTGIVHHNDTIRDLAVELAKKMEMAKLSFTADSGNIVRRVFPEESTDGTNITVPQDISQSGLAKEAADIVTG